LIDNGYIFAMDDGLNRYYVHSSQESLLPKFIEADFCVRRTSWTSASIWTATSPVDLDPAVIRDVDTPCKCRHPLAPMEY
jgi:hypothetical protein